jgi:uncharacterized beta-barrel protein YwiB (DUF1934 family)
MELEMTKEVTITIDGIPTEDEEGAVSITAPGVYHYRNGKHFIHYEDKGENGEEAVKNTIKIASDKIEITKKGVNTTQMLFETEGITENCYHTPYGSLLLQIKTTKMQVEEGPDDLRIKLQYTLSSEGRHISDHSITIKVSSNG